MADTGMLIVISGPSRVGRSVIYRVILKRNDEIVFSVSATTRAKRPGEQDGVNYFFKTRAEFKNMIENDEFLEYTEVFGSNLYGTPRKYVEDNLKKGLDVLLDIDVKGALNVLAAYPDAVSIFIVPPSMQALWQRLTHRGTETLEQVQRRFDTAHKEIELLDEYDYVVINDVLEQAIRDVEVILRAERHKVSRNGSLVKQLQEGCE